MNKLWLRENMEKTSGNVYGCRLQCHNELNKRACNLVTIRREDSNLLRSDTT